MPLQLNYMCIFHNTFSCTHKKVIVLIFLITLDKFKYIDPSVLIITHWLSSNINVNSIVLVPYYNPLGKYQLQAKKIVGS